MLSSRTWSDFRAGFDHRNLKSEEKVRRSAGFGFCFQRKRFLVFSRGARLCSRFLLVLSRFLLGSRRCIGGSPNLPGDSHAKGP